MAALTVSVALCETVLHCTSRFNSVGVRIAQHGTADAQRTGVAAVGDRNAPAEIAVIQNRRTLLPHKRDRAWATGGGGEACRLTFTNNLVCRIGCLISVDRHVSRHSLIVTRDIDTRRSGVPPAVNVAVATPLTKLVAPETVPNISVVEDRQECLAGHSVPWSKARRGFFA